VGTGGIWRQSVLLFSRCFKNLLQFTGGEEPGGSYPIINEWGGAWTVLHQVRALTFEPGGGAGWISVYTYVNSLVLCHLISSSFIHVFRDSKISFLKNA
jgi:hypothetical protein